MNKAISCTQAPAAMGPYSQAVCTGGRLYVSGQLGIDPASGALPETFAAQARNAMENLGHILGEAGFSFADVVKTTIFLDDLANFSALNDIYGSYLADPKPARSCFQVAGLPKGAKVEIEVIAEKSAQPGG